MSEELLKSLKVIPGGKRKVVRMGDRYLVYLPQNLNHIWQYLHQQKQKVEVYIIVKEADENE